MKFHKLELEAFGVFRDHQKVDFDQLNESSLFLIRGNNGAGKTTILDAICFALYGDVPGNRGESRKTKVDGQEASSLKSDYADDSVKPFVELEFTVSGSRYRVRRTPSWQSTKKKTEEKQKATLHKFQNGSWGDPLATSVPDVNMMLFGWKRTRSPKEVREPGILGLDIDQFSMIVMLPQGKFSEFLKASSEVRATLLGAIFPVRTYEEIIENLQAQLRDVKTQIETNSLEISQSFHFLLGALGVVEELPEDLEAWLHEKGESLNEARETAKKNFLEQSEKERVANEVFSEAKAKEQSSAEFKSLSDALVKAKAAKSELEAELKKVGLEGVDPLKPKLKADLDKEISSLSAEIKAIKSRTELASKLARLAAELEKARAGFDKNKADIAKAKSESNELKPKVKVQVDLIRKQNDLKEKLSSLEALKQHLSKIETANDAVAEAKKELELGQSKFKTSKDTLDKITVRREHSMSARLASNLVEGLPCSVCGSKTHPKLATFDGSIPTDDEVETAQLEFDKHQEARLELQTKLASAESNYKTLADQLLETFNVADVTAARKELQKEEAFSKDYKSVRDSLNEAEVAEGRIAEIEGILETLEEAKDPLKSAVTDLEAEIREANKALSELGEAPKKSEESDVMSDRLQLLESQSLALENIQESWQEAQSAVIAAEAKLSQIKVKIGKTGITVEQAKSNFEAAQALASKAKTEVDRVESGLAALKVAQENLPKLLKAKAKLLIELDERKMVSEVANGQTGRRVNIINFYLGQRLKQIAELASARLMKMSNDHFMLEHSETATAGNKRIGLELNSFDTWTGARRPVSDLGGGELFMASLSLALALSDVVKSESGTTVSLDTLFIDEGFGSLDATFADTVVSALEDLRTYGRTVGLVSHVESIQERIPTQLIIEKTMTGSRVLPIKVS